MISYHLVFVHLLFPDPLVTVWCVLFFCLLFSVIREELTYSLDHFCLPLSSIVILDMSLVLIPELSYNFVIFW